MKTTQRIFLLMITVASCTQPTTDQPVIEAGAAAFSIEQNNPPLSAPLHSPPVETIIDTLLIGYQELVLREALEASSTKILTTGQFHQKEVWPEALTQPWIGLFKREEEYFLQQVQPTFDRVQDMIVDSGDEKTAWEVSTELVADCILLITGVDLGEGPVPSIGIDAPLSIGDTLDTNLEMAATKIILTGTREDALIGNYKMVLQSFTEGLLVQQVVVEEASFIPSMINVIWAGDLDGDDRLDLIIDTSNHENVTAPTLFLSSEATGDALVKPVAIHWTVGC